MNFKLSLKKEFTSKEIRTILDRIKNKLMDEESGQAVHEARKFVERAAWSYPSSDASTFLKKAYQSLDKLNPRELKGNLRDWKSSIKQILQFVKESSMSSLKNQLIKLGDRNPELRKHIRPVLDRISAATPKSQLYNDVIELREDLQEARKKLKRIKKGLRKYDLDGAQSDLRTLEDHLSEALTSAGLVKHDVDKNLT